MKKKKLEDITVQQLDADIFATDKPVYTMLSEGEKLIDLPHGILIYTGKVVDGPAGFKMAVCLRWEGKDEADYESVILRKKK